MLGVSGLNV